MANDAHSALLCRLLAVAAVVVTAASAPPLAGRPGWSETGPARLVEVGYGTRTELTQAVRSAGARVVQTVKPLRVALVATTTGAGTLRHAPGIAFATPAVSRRPSGDPALTPGVVSTPYGGALEWQYYATAMDHVPAGVLQAAARITVGVVDTGADLGAPDLVGKVAGTYDVQSGKSTVTDTEGHGTFVASLVGGSGTGMAGFGGSARLLIVKAAAGSTFNDVDVAAGIVYAVRHGARIVTLSVTGKAPSVAERRAIAYATAHDVLLVAAVGNDGAAADAPEYPAALLQPVGSDGLGGAGLAVGASGPNGARAPFSEHGSFVSLAAPGENVYGAVSRSASTKLFPRTTSATGTGEYGFASGTSFAAPEVAGAAALVWAADPSLTAARVAQILKQTASGEGTWTPELGFGVIDVAAAVAAAQG